MKSKSVKLQIKQMKKQKQNFLKLVKNNYTVYDADFLIELIFQYIKDLYKFHNTGNNIWCSKEEHDKIMESLNEAYNTVLTIEQLDGTNSSDMMEYLKEHDKYMHKLFEIIVDHYNEWWD